MFHALLAGRVDTGALQLSIELLDIQELNEGVLRGRFDCSKASAAMAVTSSDRFEICDAGAAIGFGVGPLLVARPKALPLSADSRVLCPGEMTTAYLLMRRFFPQATTIEHRTFSEIMPALCQGKADYGVVIHEGRFTYESHGLTSRADLGALWEEAEQLPLPLGVIVVDRALPQEVRVSFGALVRRSIEYAMDHRDETLLTMRRFAQELDESVIWAHVDLYVNHWSLTLGDQGTLAVQALTRMAREQRVRQV
jgi:1,4-dihydroxy-6-naphthoate synthase